MKRISRYGFPILAFLIVLGTSLSATAADPTLREVYQATEAGNLKQAQTMMDQVLRDHPNSAKAHFVEAEILAKQGRLDLAKAELGTAERLAPGLTFAKPEAVRELNARLVTPVRTTPTNATAIPSEPHAEVPWGMLLLGGVLVVAAVFFFRSLSRPRIIPASGTAMSTFGPGPGMAQPYGAGGVGPMGPGVGGMAGGMGSGLLGGLATGVAVGAGVVAGEALMHRVLDGGHATETPSVAPQANESLPSDYDMGGTDFGVTDGGAWDDGSAGGGDDWS